eukprot:SAG22_NODE_1008_length_6054_cov_11.023678_4_plen_44_part_00
MCLGIRLSFNRMKECYLVYYRRGAGRRGEGDFLRGTCRSRMLI